MTNETILDMADAIGFPYEGYPTGWFQVGWSHQVENGEMTIARYFGRELLIARSEEGQLIVTDPYCPHMGAHMGHGGKVVGCAIKCPFHGWEWNFDGSNKLVPSEDQPSSTKRGLFLWPSFESNGIIWMWHDELRRDPLWDPPAERRHERNYLTVSDHTIYKWGGVKVKPPMVTENTVDLDHFVFVHKNRILPVVREPENMPELVEDGFRFHLNREEPLQSTVAEGVGILIVNFPFDPERQHRLPTLLFANTTPIDKDHSDLLGTVLVEQDKTVPGADNVVPVGNAEKRVREQEKQAGVDIPIWENMIYLQRPAYARYEGLAFKKIRNYVAKFYPSSGIELK